MTTAEKLTPELAKSILEKRWRPPLRLALLIGIAPFELEGYSLDDLLKANFGEEAFKREYDSYINEPGSNGY
jgi:hypothetical protein